jgi:transposase
MDQYVALDVSLKEVSVCVLDAKGVVVFEGRSPSDPASLVGLIQAKAPRAVKIGLETGSTSAWLAHALVAEDLSLVCMDARHAHAALSVRPSKTDRSDARGLAEMVRMGWYRAVPIKSLEAHERRALLAARHRLVVMRVDLDGQIRGLLKTFGLIVGPGNSDAFLRRAEALAEGHPVLAPLVACLSGVRRHVATQISALDREIGRIVRNDTTLRRFMTVPGVGPITALAFLSTIDDPSRFRRARDVGPYLGLTPRRHQSGEVDRQGRISKCGDGFTRKCLYEAANVLLTKVQRWSPLQAWGVRLAQRIGGKKARVALARKLAVILRCIWSDGTQFWWTKQETMMA